MTSNANPNLDYKPLEGYDVTGDQVVVAEIDSTTVTTTNGVTHGKLATSGGSGGGGGADTQYTDGGTPPTNPVGNALVFDSSGTWKDVGVDFPLPVTPPANQRVNAHAADFVDGWDATQGTTTQTKATDGSATSWSVIQLLKGILDKLLNTIGVTQSGTWNITNVSGTVSLPTGASTSAKQPALGTAGTPSTDVISVQGVASGTAQPVSGTVTANAGTNLNTSALALEAGGNLQTLAGIVSSSKAAVKAASGDFVDGSIAAIGTTTQAKATDATVTSWSVVQLLKGILNSLLTSITVAGTVTANAGTGNMGSNLTQVAGNAIATGNNAVPTLNSASAGAVAAYGSNAAALTANTDYQFKWGAGGTTQVNHVMLQNNSGSSVSWDDSAATTAGSVTLATGQTLFLDVQTANFHLQATGTPNVGGSSANNLVVKGWL